MICSAQGQLRGGFSKFIGVAQAHYTRGMIFQKEGVCGHLFGLLYGVLFPWSQTDLMLSSSEVVRSSFLVS